MTDQKDKDAASGEAALAHLAGEFVEAAVAAQNIGLALLQAEMQALTQVLPGTAAPAHSEAELARAEAQVEADFDNMPV